jgi:hypothetical protein
LIGVARPTVAVMVNKGSTGKAVSGMSHLAYAERPRSIRSDEDNDAITVEGLRLHNSHAA